ncbi:MAG TPA: sulfotransferase family 2 domain-containing protein [Bacteroidia bacterium]|nr:sulfotransferase family 2 domain-containing protein [Bacteroidia bacterium]
MNTEPNLPVAPHLLFLHIQKTAGVTMHNIIGRQYPKKNTLSIYHTEKGLAELKRLTPERASQIRLLKGHFAFGAHRFFREPCEYITMLRDPVERTISHFHFVIDSVTHNYHDMIVDSGYSLLEVLENGAIPRLDNKMVRMLSGNDSAPYGACTETMLDDAMTHLEKNFSVVGRVKNFDEFVLMCSERFHWNGYIFYRKRNAGRSRPKTEEIDKKTMDALRAHNTLDQKLYDTWSPIIEDRIARQGARFNARLASFKKKNQLLNRVLGWWPDFLTP